jgi:hypothetical protein
MTVRTVGRRTATTLAVTGVVASLAGVASADSDGKLFQGGGRGPTAEVAIQSAIDDAANSASAEQLYTCTQVGEPEVFESTNDPNFGHVFRAMATVSCTP